MNKEISSRTDIAVLSGSAGPADAEKAASIASANGCRGVLLNPCYAALCKKKLTGTDVKCIATTSYPLGTDLLAVTLYSAQQSILTGCNEILLALNMGQILSGDYETATREIELVNASVDRPFGVLVDTSLLDDTQLIRITRLAVESGAAYLAIGTQEIASACKQVTTIGEKTDHLAHVRVHGPFEDESAMKVLLEAGADGFIVDISQAEALFR